MRGDLSRQQLDDAVAELSDPARAVFDDILVRGLDKEPAASAGFNALASADQAHVRALLELRKQLVDSEAATRPDDPRHRRWWIMSILYSLVCLLATVGVLYAVHLQPPKPDRADNVATTSQDVTNFLSARISPPPPGAPPAISIPTGIYVTLVQFTGPYTVEVAGLVWQRYANNLPQDLHRGIFIPNAKDQPTLKEVYRERSDTEELVGWNFHVTLRETFDYNRYPMDRHQIRLRMWHPDFERNVFLTPDFSSYTSTVPSSMPGVDTGLVLEDWDLLTSFFSFRTYTQNSDFGASTYAGNRVHPELYYSIVVRRQLISPLIARGITPLVTLITIFVLVTVLSKDDKRREKFGVTPGSVTIVGTGFLFAVLLSHNAMRDSVKATGILYLGYLYIITYVAILGVVLDAVLVVGRPNLRLFRHHDNLIVRLLFWPLITTAILAATIVTFLT